MEGAVPNASVQLGRMRIDVSHYLVHIIEHDVRCLVEEFQGISAFLLYFPE